MIRGENMQNLNNNEINKLKEVLFKWLDNDNVQTWASAADALIKLGGISQQQAQSEVIEYMKKATQVIEKEGKKE